jgi:hypothetical protein
MASSTVTRRPLPALAALLALLILTGLVWWRVLHRSSGTSNSAGPQPCATHSTSAPPSGTTELPTPDAVTVRVLNSTDRAGIAGKAQAALVKDGFRSPQPATNDVRHHDKIKGVGQIRFGSKGKQGATLLQYYFPGARLVRTHSKRAVVTISLGKRYRRVASPQQVRAAMRADGVGSSSAPSSSPSSSPSC